MDASLSWDIVQTHLPSGWRELAREMGLIRPQPPHLHAKITDIEQLLRLEFHRAGWEASLKQSTAEAAAAKLVDLSAVALHKWERKLGPYLARLLEQMVQGGATFAAERWAGYEVIAADGTTVQRPGAKGTTARVRYALRLSDMGLVHVDATDEHGGETLRIFQACTGQLWLGDRVYANPPGIASIVAKGADVLLRFNRGTLPLYTARRQPFDVMAHVRTVRKPGKTREWSVWVHAGTERIRGRLCVLRLPEDKANEARARLRREYGSSVGADMLEAAAWVMIVTTVPRRRLPTAQLFELYRLRWQMELSIKRDKSIGGLDNLPNFLPETIQTWLYAKLLLVQLEHTIVTEAVAFSPSATPAGTGSILASARGAAGPTGGARGHRGVAGAQVPARSPAHRPGVRVPA